jgi:hypothetical protein
MKVNHLAHILFILILSGCNTEIPVTTEEKMIFPDSLIYSDTSSTTVINNPVPEPYTKNPIYLVDNKLYIDSLIPFFKYKNEERLDLLCDKLGNRSIDSLKEIVFSSKKIKLRSKADAILLGDYQFLIGNIKINHENNVIAIMDYYEDWGCEIKLFTIDKNHNIIDVQPIAGRGGDGGDFSISTLKSLKGNAYFYTSKVGHHTMTEPVDSSIYTMTMRLIMMNKNGTFKDTLLQTDSNIVETNRVK